MTPQEQYEHLVETVKGYNPAAGFDQIRAAYEFADTHHAGQNRKDGSPFITHPLAVAQIVAEELHLDTESIVAALLHDTIEDTTATHEELAKLFSPTVADLVEGVSKLTRVHYTSKEEEQMENLRKMLMAMAKDIRVILIKISDRLHNMRTMEYQTPEKQKQKSFETMEIYAPIAHRLGMQKMKWELEDLSLKYLDPVGYREITEALDEKAAEYDGFMSAVHDRIVTRLKEEGIDATVYGRMKHPYSIYRKMYTQNKSLDDVFDLFAFRVIVDTVADCYNVLGIIHDLFKPILGRFKDYIGTPKPNMYQSLHTTVVGESGIPFEVQIRTKEMHEVAEYGVAAHWKYKQNGQGAGDERSYEWVRRLLENQEGADAVIKLLDEGKNVVFITLGCPTVYATCIYVHKLVLKAGYDAELVAGVTSICAVAAKLNVSLCERAEPLIVLPGSYKEASKFLDGPGNKVLMKSASEIARVRDELKERGLIKNAAMVERCGLPGEKVYRDLNEIDPNSSYFSVILVKEKEFDK